MLFIIIAGVLVITLTDDLEGLGIILILSGVFFLFAGFYYIRLCFIPKILAELKGGLIYFYPSKKRMIEIEPQNIKMVSEKNYVTTRFNTQRDGSIMIVTVNRNIMLKHVSEIESVRLELEKLRDEALQKLVESTNIVESTNKAAQKPNDATKA